MVLQSSQLSRSAYVASDASEEVVPSSSSALNHQNEIKLHFCGKFFEASLFAGNFFLGFTLAGKFLSSSFTLLGSCGGLTLDQLNAFQMLQWCC